MRELYRGYTIEVGQDDEPMDDAEGNLIPGRYGYHYQIFEGLSPILELIDEEHGDESEICALENARHWLDNYLKRK